jgi:hypothetical protein
MAAWDTPGLDGRTGNIRNILRTIFNSALFREHTASQQKVKTPFEFVVSSIRALRALDPWFGFTANTDGYDLIALMRRMNMRLFDREEPDGWSEFGRDWISTSSLVERTRFVQNFLSSPENPLKDLDYGSGGDDNLSDPIALIQLKLASVSGATPARSSTISWAFYSPAKATRTWILIGPRRLLT